MSKHKRFTSEDRTFPLTVHRHIVASEIQRAPGKRHEVEHGMELLQEGRSMHVSASFKGFGRMRWINWDAEKLYYELEGNPAGLTFLLTMIEVE